MKVYIVFGETLCSGGMNIKGIFLTQEEAKECKQVLENRRFNLEKIHIEEHNVGLNYLNRMTDISELPDRTFFYVENGAWQGYVTTENGEKICYAGASKSNPTEEYIHRFVVNSPYKAKITIL